MRWRKEILRLQLFKRSTASLVARAGSESVNTRRGVMKQSLALSGGVALGEAFESVPNNDIRINSLFHGKVALEHAAFDAEFFDAKIKIGRHRRSELRRCGRRTALVPVEAGTIGP